MLISGCNGRHVIHGALTAATGELATLRRARGRQDHCLAVVEAPGRVRPAAPKPLIWDKAPPHHPKRVRAAAAAARITIAWGPCRSPERNPCEDLWRPMKAVVAANRVDETVQALAEYALAWLDALPLADRVRTSGLLSPKFQWLST